MLPDIANRFAVCAKYFLVFLSHQLARPDCRPARTTRDFTMYLADSHSFSIIRTHSDIAVVFP